MFPQYHQRRIRCSSQLPNPQRYVLPQSHVRVNTPSTLRFLEENLLSTAEAQADNFFITSIGALLKDRCYKVIRKLGRGHCSNTFLIEDLQPKCVREYYTTNN